jgi:hypothetical protein
MSLVRAAPLLVLASLVASPLAAQSGSGLRGLIPGLFRFGDCDEALCLNSSVSASEHGDHYIASATTGTENLLEFLTGAISIGVSNVPISTATSGITFRIVGGVPVPTSSSSGPIFGERVQTLGRGRWLIGANVTGVEFSHVRGVPLDNIAFNFTHQNICRATGQEPTPGSACPGGGPLPLDSALGSPGFENDIIVVNTTLNLNLQVASLYLTYGLTDRIDLGVAVPFVRADLEGGSIARLSPFVTPSPHFFGTPANQQFTAGAAVSGTATGIGDVAARLKINLGGTDRGAVGLLTEARFPTGDEKDFLGSGEFALRALGVVSGRYGNFSPHLNVGYLYRATDKLTDAVLTTLGFDHLLGSGTTLAVDLIGQWQATRNPLPIPGPVTFTLPAPRRQVTPTSIPSRPDNILDGSFGFKFLSGRGITLITNVLVPLNNGGMRGNVTWTGGAAYNF